MRPGFPGRCCAALALLLAFCSAGAASLPRVEIRTSLGTMEVELYPDQAPATVENFLAYVVHRFYNGTVFHRVIDGWVIQGGGYDSDYHLLETAPPVQNEANNGLSNVRGTIAMARASDPHSADSQFYINLDDNLRLDHSARTERGWGYCVFGRVVSGMDVADAIGAVPVQERADVGEHVPLQPVVIERIRLLED